MNGRDIEDIVGDDLCVLIGARRLSVVSITRVSSLNSASWGRAAFRLMMADGSSLKGRRLESSQAARRVVELGRHLPDEPFPRVLAHHNAALLFPWIEGTLLSPIAAAPDLLREMGAIQRAVHAVDVPADMPEAVEEHPGPRWRAEFGSRVAWLASVGALATDEGEHIVRLAAAHAPAVSGLRFVHGDICPDNVIIDPRGRPRVIDNDGIDFHAPEFDLARTWYRWPMTDEQRVRFDEGYGDPVVLASYREHFLHWALIVLVGAIEFRVRFQLGGASGPVTRMRELLT